MDLSSCTPGYPSVDGNFVCMCPESGGVIRQIRICKPQMNEILPQYDMRAIKVRFCRIEFEHQTLRAQRLGCGREPVCVDLAMYLRTE